MKSFFSWVCLLGLLMGFVGNTNGQTLQDSLIAYYPMSGSGDDQSGNGHHATVIGAIPTTDRFGVDSSAYYFDGIDDYLELPAVNSMKPTFPISISAWIQMDNATLNNIFTNNFDNDTYYGVWINVNASGYVGLTYGDGGPCGPQSRRSKNGTSVIQTGNWTHIVGVIRSATDMDICVNGADDGGSYSGTGGNLNYSNNPGRIGSKDALTTSPPNYFQGKIDDIRFWNRALRKAEVEVLFNETPTSTSEPDLGAEANQDRVKVWPNPAIDEIHFQLPDHRQNDGIVRLCNLEGKVLLELGRASLKGKSEVAIDVSGLARGTYFLTYQSFDHLLSRKVVLSN